MGSEYIDCLFQLSLNNLKDVYLKKRKLTKIGNDNMDIIGNSDHKNDDFSIDNDNSKQYNDSDFFYHNEKDFEREKLKLTLNEQSILMGLDHILGKSNSCKSFLSNSLNIILSKNNDSITKIIAETSGRSCYHINKKNNRKQNKKNISSSINHNISHSYSHCEKYLCLGNHYCSCPAFASSVYYNYLDNNLSYGQKRFKCVHLLAIRIAESLNDEKYNKVMDIIYVQDEKFADSLLINFPDISTIISQTIKYNEDNELELKDIEED